MIRRNNATLGRNERLVIIGSANRSIAMIGSDGEEGGKNARERRRIRLHGKRYEAVILGNVAFQNVGARA